MRYLCLAFAFVACTCASTLRGYQSEADRIEYEASLRIIVDCPAGQQVGSGVAITPRHVITAKHVVECMFGTSTKIIARTRHGASLEMALDKISIDEDIARLVVVGTGEPFHVYASVSLTKPKTGEKVCAVGGDGPAVHSIRKCADIATVTDTYIVMPIGAVPGNSGSGLFNGAGEIVGILTRGRWEPSGEKLGLAIRATSWQDLVPLWVDLGF